MRFFPLRQEKGCVCSHMSWFMTFHPSKTQNQGDWNLIGLNIPIGTATSYIHWLLIPSPFFCEEKSPIYPAHSLVLIGTILYSGKRSASETSLLRSPVRVSQRKSSNPCKVRKTHVMHRSLHGVDCSLSSVAEAKNKKGSYYSLHAAFSSCSSETGLGHESSSKEHT